MWKDSSTSIAHPPTSHHHYRCSTWLLRKVISWRYNFPSNTPGAAKMTSHYWEIITPGTFGNICHFGITLSWDPSFPHTFPEVLEGVTGLYSKWKVLSQARPRSIQPLLIVWKFRADNKQSIMAAAMPPIPFVVPPYGAPTVATTPHLPFGANPGTITRWLLDATSTETSSDISNGLALGFNPRVETIPAIRDPG